MKKRRVNRPLVWVIEDSKEHAGLMKRDLEEIGCSVEHYDSAQDAAKAEGSPGLVFLDVAGMSGGIGPIGVSIHALSYAAIAALKEHPGAVVCVYSGVLAWAQDMVEELKEGLPDNVFTLADMGMDFFYDIREIARTHLGLSRRKRKRSSRKV